MTARRPWWTWIAAAPFAAVYLLVCYFAFQELAEGNWAQAGIDVAVLAVLTMCLRVAIAQERP